MARLSDQTINRVKQEVSLVELVTAKGFKLKPHGKDFAMCCPFHQDDTASLIITPEKNLWHCMGACQTGGSVIDWVMKTEGVSFRHAVELLKNDLPHLAAVDNNADKIGQPKVVKQSTTPKLPPPLAANADKQTALTQVIDYYHETLKTSPDALAYLDSRGLNNEKLINTFKLGFANRTLAYRLPQKNRKAGAELRGLLQEVGIFRDSGHEHFNGSIVVPIMDEKRLISEVYGRKILGKRLRKGTAQHLYLPGPHQGVWNSQAFKASEEIILCEALIDAMTFWVHGFRNVTASYGTSGFTDDHLALMQQHQIKRVLIAYDRDEAGNTAAEQLATKLTKQGIDCFRIQFPKNMDANEYAKQVTPAAKSLGIVIRKAVWMGSGQQPSLTTVKEPEPMKPEATTPKASTTAAKAENELPSLAAEPSHATPMPQPQAVEIPAEVNEQEATITLGPRRYRIRGIDKNTSYEVLKVNVLVSQEERFHVDTFDLYSARLRAGFIKQASIELGVDEKVIKGDLGKVLLKLEALQEQHIQETLKPKEATVTLSDSEQRDALEVLQSPNLLSRILTDFTEVGVVGEETNKLVGYLATVSRKLDKPLAVLIQSSSAAGKSSLMDAVLSLMPEEERVQYSAMTGQSLFYMGETNLKHKILAIAEEEGAENASYALKLLQSEGEITIASTGKDNTTGNLTTQEYRVEGPVMLFLTTTAIDIDEELKNRCLVLTVNENRLQTEAIHTQQRFDETLEGLLKQEKKHDLIALHRNAQRLLKPFKVVNPYANALTFLNDKTRTRRDHKKYLTLIRSIALLHQYQRPIKTVRQQDKAIQYIEVTLEDIETANQLAHEVLGRTLDELAPQTRNLLLLIDDMVCQQCQTQAIKKSDYRFTRREVRETVGWTDFQVKTHMKKLEQLEYVLVHRGGRGQSFIYELLYSGEGQSGKPFLMGLADTEQLKQQYDANKEHQKKHKELSSSPQVGTKEHPGSDTENTINTGLNGKKGVLTEKEDIKAEELNLSSHRTSTALAATAAARMATGAEV